jgi:hypothetical protein
LECYNKVPKSVANGELGEKSVEKWQRDWDQTSKRKTTKKYFPMATDRLNKPLNITSNFTTMVTGHGNIRSYLHRFKILDTPTCSCGTKNQTVDHLLYEYELLNTERDSLISTVLQTDVWPISKETLIRKHFKIFVKFTKEISFDKLNEVSNPLRQAS